MIIYNLQSVIYIAISCYIYYWLVFMWGSLYNQPVGTWDIAT